MAYEVIPTPGERWRNRVPFGLLSTKPRHFRDMFQVLWRNRDNLPYAYKVITRGVCDGCALGVAGLHDWTIDGVHLCMTRLNLLRLDAIPALIRPSWRMSPPFEGGPMPNFARWGDWLIP